ncbi:uncharacterized protein [Montipora foliosa]|uniref:uncharacterized protein n=1 Tax=Montipora foliosa TaxID=591990 RepID=UPI0035F181AA
MERLNGINFDRCLTPADATGAPTLCIFADASGDAFGTCAYARWQLRSGEFDVRLVAAKSRAAPIKSLTIPRLELQGAVLASRLLKAIKEETRLNFEQKVFFLGSKIVLEWICSEARRFRPFVSIRFGKIQNSSDLA